MDNKQENFRRIASNRTSKIINMISSLGNLTNSSFYEYTDDQEESMIAAIESEIKNQRKVFESKKEKKQRKFEL